MYIVVNHKISDAPAFWSAIQSSTTLPEGFKAHSVFPGIKASEATCIWQAPDVQSLNDLLSPIVGKVCENTYMQVNEANAMGLPA